MAVVAELGLPFFISATEEKCYRFSCHKLTPEGRCSIYETRPEHPCRSYLAGEDLLCVLFRAQLSREGDHV